MTLAHYHFLNMELWVVFSKDGLLRPSSDATSLGGSEGHRRRAHLSTFMLFPEQYVEDRTLVSTGLSCLMKEAKDGCVQLYKEQELVKFTIKMHRVSKMQVVYFYRSFSEIQLINYDCDSRYGFLSGNVRTSQEKPACDH